MGEVFGGIAELEDGVTSRTMEFWGLIGGYQAAFNSEFSLATRTAKNHMWLRGFLMCEDTWLLLVMSGFARKCACTHSIPII